MNSAEAIAIREEAIAAGLKDDPEVALLAKLGTNSWSLPPATTVATRDPVVGSGVEQAARSLRRKIRERAA